MSKELYQWQKEVVEKYSGNGTIVAVTAAGKTYPAIEIAKRIGGRILVSSNRRSIIEQWEREMPKDLNVEYHTFQALCKQHFSNIDLLIVDECHRSTSKKFIKLYQNVKYKNILGLTATPDEECIRLCGPKLCDVSYDEANISPFTVVFRGINLTDDEYHKYVSLSRSISGLMQKEEKDNEDYQILKSFVMNRRSLVYNAKDRLPVALGLIAKNANENKKILVICQRIDQVNKISYYLDSYGLDYVVYHSKEKGALEDYQKGKVNICLSVGMLKEGFNDPDTDVGIIVSTTLSRSFNLQAIGRIIRFKKEKEAVIYILLANKTSDLDVIKHSDPYKHTLENIEFSQKQENPELYKKYYNGEKYSFRGQELWRIKKSKWGGREYFQYHPILKKLREIKPSGGSFVVMEGEGVFTKHDGQIVQVSSETPTFTPLAAKFDFAEKVKAN